MNKPLQGDNHDDNGVRASRVILIAAIAAIFTTTAFAQTEPKPVKFDTADTAWMITATALVLMMSIPGLALFYAGMVRKKNVLATMVQTFAAVSLGSIVWLAVGYSLVFSGDGPAIGNFARIFGYGIDMGSVNPLAKNIPEIVFMLYQMTFAVITVALVAGSVADRMRFSAFLWFVISCFCSLYPGRTLGLGRRLPTKRRVLDFAGGTVVHLNAGIAGLVAAYLLGKRRGYGTENLAPHDPDACGDRHRALVGRLVRFQRRLGSWRQFARRLSHCCNTSRGMRGRAHLDVAGMAGA